MWAWLKSHKSSLLSTTLIVVGLGLIAASYYQQLSSELWYWWQSSQHIRYTVDPTLPDTNNKVRTIKPASTSFGLIIERINVNEKVAANIDPFNEAEYSQVLKTTSVAHAKNTAYPGQSGVSYLFGHSTVNLWEIGAYHAPFTLLHKLEKGDRIITYYKNQRYDYTVTQKKVVAPTDLSILQEKTDQSILVLQTCDPPGENTARLLVVAELQ